MQNKNGTETLKCPTCGNTYENTKKGRTKQYCSSNCKNFFKYFNALEKVIINSNFCDSEARLNKGALFRMANLIKIDSKRVKS